jgi:hypothetical protein
MTRDHARLMLGPVGVVPGDSGPIQVWAYQWTIPDTALGPGWQHFMLHRLWQAESSEMPRPPLAM